MSVYNARRGHRRRSTAFLHRERGDAPGPVRGRAHRGWRGVGARLTAPARAFRLPLPEWAFCHLEKSEQCLIYQWKLRACHAEGRGFESRRSRQSFQHVSALRPFTSGSFTSPFLTLGSPRARCRRVLHKPCHTPRATFAQAGLRLFVHCAKGPKFSFPARIRLRFGEIGAVPLARYRRMGGMFLR